MYKVFNNDNLIILNSEPVKTISANYQFRIENRTQMHEFLNQYSFDKQNNDISIFGYNIDELYSDFCSFFEYLEAAGGIVKNKKGEYLFIKRWEYWDLPKGKIEKNESAEEASLREVEEETAVNSLWIVNELNSTYHIYPHNGNLILKKTFWYNMQTSFSGELRPQINEDIEKAEWKTIDQARLYIKKSYRSLNEAFGTYFS